MAKSWGARLRRLPQARTFAQELINKVKIKVLRNLGVYKIISNSKKI